MVLKPFLLHAHIKPITWLKYNKEGDLLFVSSKDQSASVWYTETGELLGTFDHDGAVFCIDVNDDSTRALTATSKFEAIIWDVKTGQRVMTYTLNAPAKTVQFAEGDSKFLVVTDKYGSQTPSTIHVFNIPHEAMDGTIMNMKVKEEPVFSIPVKDTKVNTCMWGPLNRTIIAGCEDGVIRCYDAETQQELGKSREHQAGVNKITCSNDKLLFITASSDNTAKMFETKTLELVKTYRSTEPVNCAAISPLKYHIILGGGTPAVDVTKTYQKGTTFDIHFYHSVFEEHFGRVKGHFGPVHHVSFNPDGTGFATGGEDGYVRLHHFDESYLKMRDTPESME